MIGGISNDWAGGLMSIAAIDWTDWKNHYVVRRIAGRMEDECGTNRGRMGDELGRIGILGWIGTNWIGLGRIQLIRPLSPLNSGCFPIQIFMDFSSSGYLVL